jgi:peptide chain release factor 1
LFFSRITDHRINFTTHQLHGVLDGDLTELIEALTTFYTAQSLKEVTEGAESSPAASTR